MVKDLSKTLFWDRHSEKHQTHNTHTQIVQLLGMQST